MLGPQVAPTDIYSEPIKKDDVIVYGVGRGSIDFGIIEEVIFTPGERRVYDRNTNTSTTEDYWKVTLKVAKKLDRWSKTKFVRLQSTGHVFVLDGSRANDVRKDIEDSWVDTGL